MTPEHVIAIVATVFITTVGGCTIHQNSVLEGMVKAGANPMEASCAVSDSKSNAVCALLAGKK